MGSMHMRLDFAGHDAERLAAFYSARARGGVGLIITGGIAPNRAGRMEEDAAVLDSDATLDAHRHITDAVHAGGAACVMQILHAGRYARHAMAVAPSAIPSPLGGGLPHQLNIAQINKTIDDYVCCASLAERAGYDGVDIMGSEGYLLNQFVVKRTNQRDDEWGGAFANRIRLPLEIVRRVRTALPRRFTIIFRIPALDLVEDGSTVDETLALARALEAAGADALCTGIGWHESRIPTIASMVPAGTWRFTAARLKRSVTIPVIASNRIDTPELAESLLESGDADLVALARPLLADPDFLSKARSGQPRSITPCIACNQSCLDRIFSGRVATCMVNPRAGNELGSPSAVAPHSRQIAIVGAGPAGLSCAITAAARGHRVVLFEANASIGGQFALARQVPSKRNFGNLIDHYRSELTRLKVDLRLSTPFSLESAMSEKFERVVIATGTQPRVPRIRGIEHPSVSYYPDVLRGAAAIGENVAIIGAGAIAFDVAEFLTDGDNPDTMASDFLARWGVDKIGGAAGGLIPAVAQRPPRRVTLLQRRPGRAAARLGASTGWIVRAMLKQRGASIITGCEYEEINDDGICYSRDGHHNLLAVDSIVVCAGQQSPREVFDECVAAGLNAITIGGALNAEKLDAERAIAEGYRAGLEC